MTDALSRPSVGRRWKKLIAEARQSGKSVAVEVFHSHEGQSLLNHIAKETTVCRASTTMANCPVKSTTFAPQTESQSRPTLRTTTVGQQPRTLLSAIRTTARSPQPTQSGVSCCRNAQQSHHEALRDSSEGFFLDSTSLGKAFGRRWRWQQQSRHHGGNLRHYCDWYFGYHDSDGHSQPHSAVASDLRVG